ncbi:MAG: UDP-N-acetylglucosamine 2-epimerase [Promethearchaeia archaeon]
MRKVCVITGTRAEYGLLSPIIEKIDNSKKLKLQIIVTGMHLSKEFGNTYLDIIKDGYNIDKKVDMLLSGDSLIAMVKSIGIGILGLSQAIQDLNPDFIMILGDRVEAFAGAIAGAFLKKVVCHIHGGDSPRAGFDEYMRHAITKISHLHFTATKKSYERVIKLGERKEYVFLTGAPGLDVILNKPLYSRREVEKFLKLDENEKYFLLIQHSVSTQPDLAKKQIKITLKAIKKFNIKTVIIYPNSDAGGISIINELEKLKYNPNFILFPSLEHKCYLSILKYCSVLIGNSSSGIIEAPSFHIPVVNIGTRQEGRERSENIIDVPYNSEKIENAIKKALEDESFLEKVKNCINPYGDGKASEKIIKVLEDIEINENIFLKKITY